LLAGRAALRSGAGKVRVGFLTDAAPAVDFDMPELMLGRAEALIESGADAFVVGCGLGTDEVAQGLLRRAIGVDRALVLDADALNLIAGDASLATALGRRSAPTLATPHPAEAARLLRTNVESVQRDRLASAAAIARTLSAEVVLKGRGSVIANAEGRFAINCSGNPALASAGSGDVLAGIIGALLAQGIEATVALRLGVCLHGAAADALVAHGIGPLGVGASELPDAARALLNEAARTGR